MSTSLIVFRTHRIGFSNIIPALIMTAIGKQGFETCSCNLLDDKYVNAVLGGFASNFPVADPDNDLRRVQWENDMVALQYLDDFMVHVRSQNKLLGMGCHSPTSIAFLKERFQDEMKIGGSHYTEDFYPYLIQSMAEQHVFMITSGRTTPSDYDQELLTTLNQEDLVNHYRNTFDRDSIIPTSTESYDHSFNLANVFNKTLVVDYVEALGLDFTAETDQYYSDWAAANSASVLR